MAAPGALAVGAPPETLRAIDFPGRAQAGDPQLAAQTLAVLGDFMFRMVIPEQMQAYLKRVQNRSEGSDLRVKASRHEGPGSKRAVTRYRVTGSRGRFALVEVVIDTLTPVVWARPM